MNRPRTIMDGIVMALFFNAVVGVGFLMCPIAGLMVAGIGILLG